MDFFGTSQKPSCPGSFCFGGILVYSLTATLIFLYFLKKKGLKQWLLAGWIFSCQECAGEEQEWGEQRTIPAFAEHEVQLILGKTTGRRGTNSPSKEISLGGIQPCFLTAQSCIFHGITGDVILGGTSEGKGTIPWFQGSYVNCGIASGSSPDLAFLRPPRKHNWCLP